MISDGYVYSSCYPTHILKDINGTYLVAHIKEDTYYGDSVHIARVGKNGTAIAQQTHRYGRSLPLQHRPAQQEALPGDIRRR